MKNPTAAQKDQEMIERRMKVASYRLGGVRDQRLIAKELNTSPATINRDFKALNAEWAERARAMIDEEKGVDLDRTDRLIAAMWTKARNGDERAAKMVLELMQHRAKLLGLNAPEKRELSTANDIPLKIIIENIGAEVVE